jgi:hypothetical protein
VLILAFTLASLKFQEFKDENEDWPEQLEAFREVHILARMQDKTYYGQQRDLERLFEVFEMQAERARLAHFEVMFAIVGSTIFQNDALNCLYFTPGLTEVRILSF